MENKLDLRLDKCTFLEFEMDYLGYRVSSNGVSPTNHGVKAFINFPTPQNIREIQCFLGLCAYFRKFVAGFSIIAKPIYDLLRKNARFIFGERKYQAFEILKTKLMQAPVLSIYDPRDETELHYDASKLRYGAVLLQRKRDNKFHPIFYFSRCTTDVDSRYHSFELETLAVIYALRRFSVYLEGILFKIITDCNALKLTLDKKEINSRIERRSAELESYDKVFESIRSVASKNIEKSQIYKKRYFDKKRKDPHNYELGDFVMTKNFDTTVGAVEKLIPQYKGPYQVIKKLRNDRYALSDIENFQLTQKPYMVTWEACNLKPWESYFVAMLCEQYFEHFSSCNFDSSANMF